MAAGALTIDALCKEDPHVKMLSRLIRDGRGMSLEDAVEEACQFHDRAKVHHAADRIRQLQREISEARWPRAVVAGNIETWYFGARSESDRNWSALRRTLEQEGWSPSAISDLDQASNKVVANLPDPHGPSYRCRGLVLGYVQSGKTTNFTAVIAKAADAGYRFFIVLSGIHNALRWQTQHRLNTQLRDPNSELWYPLTDEQDFQKSTPNSVDALLSSQDKRVLAVVKKNPTRLRALRDWLFGARPDLLADCPVLIIDDEADQASINTAKRESDRTAINRLITEIANGLPKSAYVGYTATPFANVLIDPQDFDDLYPRDFIVDLPKPEVYIGPEAIFGREPLEFDTEGDVDDGHDFVRSVPVDELDGLRPKGTAARHDFEPEITPSLDEALRYFLLSTAARRVRGIGNPHATALVHTSQHVDVHERTAREIERHVRTLASRLAGGDASLLAELERQWDEECRRVPAEVWDLEPVSWEDVERMLPVAAADAQVVTDNSRTPPDERLSFDADDPRVIIAVGGNTLSRGLTLEGLAVSFFVRSASAYDTLLQMGRWFGYRRGYEDLTRIWLTDEMREWFHHLATVEQEIRNDIARYTEHIRPDELGVRIRTHPKLAITAAAKMQRARPAKASYSGRRLQTILFNHRDREWLSENITAGRELIQATRDAPRHSPRRGITIIGPVPSTEIIRFLSRYRFHENSRDLNSKLITTYIDDRRKDGELTHFRIAVMGRDPASERLGALDLGLEQPVGCINRARLDVVGGATYADIKALMSRADRVIDLDLDTREVEEMSIGQLAAARNLPRHGGRGDGTGLLLLYPISKDSTPTPPSEGRRKPLEAVEHVLGAGLVFPESLSRDAGVRYLTADIASMQVEVETPDEDDDLVETEEDAA